jgi:hypothetical protein
MISKIIFVLCLALRRLKLLHILLGKVDLSLRAFPTEFVEFLYFTSSKSHFSILALNFTKYLTFHSLFYNTSN